VYSVERRVAIGQDQREIDESVDCGRWIIVTARCIPAWLPVSANSG